MKKIDIEINNFIHEFGCQNYMKGYNRGLDKNDKPMLDDIDKIEKKMRKELDRLFQIQPELKKGESWRLGFTQGVKEGRASFGKE